MPLPPSLAVVAPSAFRHGSAITKAQLESLRGGFWATRVEGNYNMWLALKSAAEALLEKDVMMANAILGASNITTPLGNLSQCYDELGDAYKVPEYCYADPIELNERQQPHQNGLFKAFTTQHNSGKSQPQVTNLVDTPLAIRVKINPSDVVLVVDSSTGSSVDELKKSIYEKTLALKSENEASVVPVCDVNRQRLIFMGKELKSGQVIGDVGVDDIRVLQVFLRKEEAEVTSVL